MTKSQIPLQTRKHFNAELAENAEKGLVLSHFPLLLSALRGLCVKIPRLFQRFPLVIGIWCLVICLAGCTGGKFAVRSESPSGNLLTGDFTTAIYNFSDNNTLSIILLEGTEQKPTQLVHVQMLWLPVAGKTPIDLLATNATINYVVFTGQGAGVYRGAGFLFPKNSPGGSSFTADLKSSSMRLLDASPTFIDRLGLSKATGSFTATRDDAQALRLLRLMQTQLHEQLGYPSFVQK